MAAPVLVILQRENLRTEQQEALFATQAQQFPVQLNPDSYWQQRLGIVHDNANTNCRAKIIVAESLENS